MLFLQLLLLTNQLKMLVNYNDPHNHFPIFKFISYFALSCSLYALFVLCWDGWNTSRGGLESFG